LHVEITSDAKGFGIEKATDSIDLIYTGLNEMNLGIQTVR
jgi:hypothetical protein